MWRHEMLAVVIVFCFCFFVLFCFVFFISLYVQLSAILNLYRCYTCTHFSAKIRALKILSYICRLMLIIHSYNDMYIKTHHKVNIFYLYYIKVRCHHKNHLRKMFTIDIEGFPEIQGCTFGFVSARKL